MLIADGLSNIKVKVNKTGELCINTASAIHQASLRGDAYAWNAISANIDATDNILLIENQSDSRLLVISFAYIQADVVGQTDFKLCDMTGLTMDGTVVTAVNLNRSSIKKPDAMANSDDTQSAAATVFFTYYQHFQTAAQTTTAPIARIDFEDSIVLGKNDAFGIDQVTEPGGFEATAFGYYIDA